MSAKFPLISAYAHGWDPQTTLPQTVRTSRLDWVCPGCGGLLEGVNVSRLSENMRLEDVPELLKQRCDFCSGRTLANNEVLVGQFVASGFDGQLDPRQVLVKSRDVRRNTGTQWLCESCGDPFTLSIDRSLFLAQNNLALHRTCRARGGATDQTVHDLEVRLAEVAWQEQRRVSSIEARDSEQLSKVHAEAESKRRRLSAQLASAQLMVKRRSSNV